MSQLRGTQQGGRPRALLLAGTGAIGTPLCRELANHGWSVTTTSRQPRHPESVPWNTEIGDAKQSAFLERLLRQEWDVVIDFLNYSTQEFRARATRLLEYCRHYIFISSARVLADSMSDLNEESSRLLDVLSDSKFLDSDEYCLSKARQEDALAQSGRTNWTIIRPYITYGDNRLQLGILEKEDWLNRALRGSAVIFCEEMLEIKTTMTSASDVASAIAAIAGDDRCMGQVFNITTSEPRTWAETLGIYSAALHELGVTFRVHLVHSQTLLQIKPATAQLYYDRMYSRRFDNTKLDAIFNTSSFVDPESGLRRSLVRFVRRPTFRAVDWRRQGMMDACTHGRVPAGEIPSVRSALSYIRGRTTRMHPSRQKASRWL